jgi:hypothetical protein
MYFDWDSLFIHPQIQRQKFEQMGLSEKEVVSRMNKILEAETLIPPLAMPGIGVGGGGRVTVPQDLGNSYVDDDYVESGYFE